MKIAVFHNLPSGGAKRALYSAVWYLTGAGHQVDVYVPSSADENYLSLKGIANGFHVYPVRRTWRGLVLSLVRHGLDPFSSVADVERDQERIAALINAGPYDLVFSEQDQCTYSPFLLRYTQKPTVYYCQQPSRVQELALDRAVQTAFPTARVPTYRKLWRAYFKSRMAAIDKENASYAKYIVTNSYFTRETILRAYGLNSFVSYLGIDTELFRPLNLPRENFILSVGSCGPHKGYDFAIRSLHLINELSRPRMVIVSNSNTPGWDTYLTNLAAELGVSLEIKNGISDSELVHLYNRTKLFVYSSILEPFGLTPLEAMACGTPVVAVKEGGVRETIIHKQTGILTDRDEKVFADAIAALLQDDSVSKQMGDKGRELVCDSWTLEQAGRSLVQHLHRASGVD